MPFFKVFANSNNRTTVSRHNWVTARAWQAQDPQGNLTTSTQLALDGLSAPVKAKLLEKEKTEAPQPATHRPRIGHASVETEGNYASFWPGESVGLNKDKVGMKESVPGRNNDSLRNDIQSEGGAATTEVTFYSLDKHKVNEEFAKMKKESPRYVMKPHPILGSIYEQSNSQNCSSSAYRLLKAGGIDELSPKCAELNSFFKIAISPDSFQACLIDAKKKEMEQFPETKNFTPQNRF